MDKNDKLNVVDENGNVLGQESRELIHAKGLLHQEIHVWFYTPRGEIIFQHRAKNKDTYPDLLDATVGGHVEIGKTYEQAAIDETMEETGLLILPSDLKLLLYRKHKSHDAITDKINNTIRAVYAYCYNGRLEDLKVEQGKGLGFEAWSIEKLFNIEAADKRRFIPSIFNQGIYEVFLKIKNLI